LPAINHPKLRLQNVRHQLPAASEPRHWASGTGSTDLRQSCSLSPLPPTRWRHRRSIQIQRWSALCGVLRPRAFHPQPIPHGRLIFTIYQTPLLAENVGFSALRTGRLDANRTCALKVPKLIASFKLPNTHRRRSFFGCGTQVRRGNENETSATGIKRSI